jgi:DNA-binding GntR family transcriptional regulator
MRGLIVSGRVAPGTRLVETEFARVLAVSRTPIREAIRRLAHEGLAYEVGAGAKTQMAVAPATLADMVDLFAIIGALEGLSGRGIVHLASDARRILAAELSTLNAEFEALTRTGRGTDDRFFAAHDTFHARITERCSSERLQKIIETVRPQVKRYEVLYATAIGRDFTESIHEHRAIVRAVRAGNPDDLEQAIRRNWLRSADRVSKALASGALTTLGDFRRPLTNTEVGATRERRM